MSVRMRRLWIQMTSDPRRFGVLCAFVVTGLLLWARIIIVSNMPRTAVATPRSGSENVATSQPAAKTSKPSTSRTTTVLDLSANPGRDPFVISPTYFPKPTSPTHATSVVDKSTPESTEDPQQIESRRTAQLQASISGIHLDASMEGLMAMIDGKAYRKGDQLTAGLSGGDIASFVLAEVRQRSVILECEGRRFELKMTTP